MVSELTSAIMMESRRPVSTDGSQAVQPKAPTSATAGVKAVSPAVSEQVREAEQAKPDQEAMLESSVKDLNQHVQMIRRNLEFSIDSDSGHTVVKVIDAETDEVVRQIPSEELLKLARYLKEQADNQGSIFRAMV